MLGWLVNFRKSSVQISSNNIQRAMKKKRLGEALSITNDISKYLHCQIIQGKININSFCQVVLKSRKNKLSIIALIN